MSTEQPTSLILQEGGPGLGQTKPAEGVLSFPVPFWRGRGHQGREELAGILNALGLPQHQLQKRICCLPAVIHGVQNPNEAGFDENYPIYLAVRVALTLQEPYCRCQIFL